MITFVLFKAVIEIGQEDKAISTIYYLLYKINMILIIENNSSTIFRLDNCFQIFF